jgi:hypothetical protein
VSKTIWILTNHYNVATDRSKAKISIVNSKSNLHPACIDIYAFILNLGAWTWLNMRRDRSTITGTCICSYFRYLSRFPCSATCVIPAIKLACVAHYPSATYDYECTVYVVLEIVKLAHVTNKSQQTVQNALTNVWQRILLCDPRKLIRLVYENIIVHIFNGIYWRILFHSKLPTDFTMLTESHDPYSL